MTEMNKILGELRALTDNLVLKKKSYKESHSEIPFFPPQVPFQIRDFQHNNLIK